MDTQASRSRLHRPSGLRGGIVIGLALALVGVAVGTATGAVTPFQQVVVVNTPEEPVPVSLQGTGAISGDVNASQSGTWNVGISGTPTVNVGNFPSTGPVTIAPATKFFGTGVVHLQDSGGNTHRAFGETINVTAIGLANTDGIDPFSDSIEVLLLPPSGVPFVPVHIGDGSAFITFTQPIPATQINFACLNDVVDCDFYATVVGY